MQIPPLSLYIHIPWCVRKCPYCDFNSHAQSEPLPIEDYVCALLQDLEQDAPLSQGRKLQSIFFGGGTPSLLPADAVKKILDGVKSLVSFENDIEITLETNPGTAEYSNFDELLRAGVNRLSIGAQSFDDLQLATLGRIHSSGEIRRAIMKAKHSGFDNINIDLMHGLPGQSTDAAKTDIEQAIALGPRHISWYQLTIEPNTEFYKTQPLLPEDDIQTEIYETGLRLLEENDYQQYEVSAFAQKNRESRHNLNYWKFGDYLAIGAGAHGKISRPEENDYFRYQKTRVPKDYLDRNRPFTSKRELVESSERPLEFLMNSLRLKSGVDSQIFKQRTGLSLELLENPLAALRKRGLIIEDKNRIQTTELGFLFLNDVLAYLSENI